MSCLIELYPTRVSPRGRVRPPVYLREFIYPPLLSGQKVQVGTTEDPADAYPYVDQQMLDSAMELLCSLGYEPTVVPAPH